MQIDENETDYPYLAGKYAHKILYVYLTGYGYTDMIDAEGCEIDTSLKPPKYNVRVRQFRTTLECINKLKGLKNKCNKLNDLKKEKYNELLSVIEQLLHDISGIYEIIIIY